MHTHLRHRQFIILSQKNKTLICSSYGSEKIVTIFFTNSSSTWIQKLAVKNDKYYSASWEKLHVIANINAIIHI